VTQDRFLKIPRTSKLALPVSLKKKEIPLFG